MAYRRIMDGTQCYEPSSLLVSVHTQLPFLTDVGDSDKTVDLVLNLGENTREFYDYFVVRGFGIYDAVYIFITFLYYYYCNNQSRIFR